ncbi:hypothetical protein AQUCO_02000408v1 [Aquilegia coerulea]|uniref:Uncharacterized protein n=1 Tax=Aquilegia coerulea TaxID=218851 RepID=A0A2G5DHF5_AQUCA|nr:hypothetical protein AQUCO_02000408v1 [Aquilegia coerulea]
MFMNYTMNVFENELPNEDIVHSKYQPTPARLAFCHGHQTVTFHFEHIKFVMELSEKKREPVRSHDFRIS